MKVIVASRNPVKIKAAEAGFRLIFPEIPEMNFLGENIASGVPDQPMGEAETRLGAVNRAKGAQAVFQDADYWVGMEGGIADTEAGMEAFAWMVVLGKEKMGEARTAAFLLPKPVAELVRGGMELGHADDLVFGKTNSKQTNGALGLLTHNALTREGLYTPAIAMALIPFLHPEWY